MTTVSSLVADFWLSWRLLGRSPGLTASAVIALALGVGFTTTMFSIVHGGTRGLPFEKPDQIVLLSEGLPKAGRADLAPRAFEFNRWQTTLGSFAGLAAFRDSSMNLAGDGDLPQRVPVTTITPGAFGLLGVTPIRGRTLAPSDGAPGAEPVVVISDALWQSRFGGAESIVGRTLRLDGIRRTVVGVMPPGFGFPIRARAWLPLFVEAAAVPGAGGDLGVFGRLRDGVTVQAASVELAVDVSALAAARPADFADRTGRVFPFTESETPPEIRRALQLLVLVVSLTLLVACANVANLLLARAAARSRDTAIRAALGASRGRLVALQLFESLALAAVASAIGLVLAWMGLRFFAAASASVLDAFWVDLRVDAVVVLFASGLGAVAAVAAGLAPALRASRAGVNALLQSQAATVAGPRIGRLGRSLVTVQVALACGLLIVTATLVRAAGELRLVPIPFPAREILTAQLSVRPDVLNDAPARRTLVRRLDAALEAAPSIRRAALVSVFPGRGAGRWSFRLATDDTTGPSRTAGLAVVTPSFFALADAPLLRGRLFTAEDDERAPLVAVVNQTFARRHFDATDPVGQHIVIGDTDFVVVGVVRDLLMEDVEDVDAAGFYASMFQVRPYTVRVMAEVGASPLGQTGALRQAVSAVDADLPLLEIASLYDAIYEDKRVLDALAVLFLAFGLGTVFLAVVGLHAVLSLVVTERMREFGVRRALGATGRDIVGLVLRRGARELVWGLGIGLALAFGISRLLALSLERISPAGVEVLAAIALVVVVGAGLAIWRPVRRALGLEPSQALRAG